MALWGTALSAGGFSATTMLFSLGASMILGGVAQMLAPKAKTPDYRATDNGRQNTYFSSLDNMIARGEPDAGALRGNAGWLPPYIPGHQYP
ncbi:hypothetical protein MS10860_1461 [Escherichia coli]|nr:hypothetical protein MS10858_1361 [Escherichia coli]WMN36616.1 hypothetical protein MS10860_1461 [Escherichia coli]